jgi:hypothetical protein
MIAGKAALLTYRPDSPSLFEPSAGYTCVWSGLSQFNNEGLATFRFESPMEHGVVIEQQAAFDFVITGADLGYFFNNAVS